MADLLSWDGVVDFVSRHYFIVFLVAFAVFRRFVSSSNAKKMENIEGSLVKSVGNLQQWEDFIKAAEGKLIVVDFFATWCGPCVRAAPVFAQMSKDMKDDQVEFWKVDVDKAAVISRAEGISCMPTFKFYRALGGKLQSLDVIQGWSEAKVRSNIAKFVGSKK